MEGYPWQKVAVGRIERVRERLRDRRTRPITIILLTVCVGLVGMLAYWIVLLTELPSTDELEKSRFEQATVVYSADGVELTSYQDKNRRWVTLDEISPWVVRALIATEDHRFYKHHGIDLWRTVGSFFRTLAGDVQGGSTITMQFARNAFPGIYDDWMVTRKIKEWITAVRIESMYDKDDILEMYLNTVPFMYNAFGIEAAAQTYFQVPASELNPKGAATLVGMLKGTAYYNPVRHPERSHERRNVVLEKMVEHGYLEPEEFEEMRDVPSTLNFKRLNRAEGLAPHFAEYLRQWLDDWAERYDINLYTGGLRVYTTIDSRLQEAAQSAVDEVGDRLQDAANRTVGVERFWNGYPENVNAMIRRTVRYREMTDAGLDDGAAIDSLRADAAFVDSLKNQLRQVQIGFAAMNPSNGHVVAWVGGRDFGEVQYDHVAMSKRQPGSTFKPFVYAAALGSGFSPVSLVRDEVVTYVDPDTRRRWSPRNVGSASGQMITLRDALAYSKNTVTAQLVQRVGASRVADYARRMGIQSELDVVPSLGLGTSPVSLLEMIGAYGTLANYGHYREPIFVTRIEDQRGNVIARFSGESRSAIPSTVAYSVLDMMRGVVDYGTGVRIRSYGVRGDVAAKTGTSQNGADGWFILVHPNLVMGSWVGFTSPSIYFQSRYYQQGAHTALPVVGQFYRNARRVADDVLSTEARFRPPAGWVEPQPPDTSYHDAEMRYAAYLDSIGVVRDSLRIRSDSLLGDPFDEDDLEENGSEYEMEEPYEDIEDVETADSLNRAQRVLEDVDIQTPDGSDDGEDEEGG